MAKSKTKSAAKSKTTAKSKPAKPAAATLAKAVASQENLDQSGREFYNEELKQDAAARAAKRAKAKSAVAAVIENGIRRPGASTLCGRVWQALDDLRTAGVDPTAKNAKAAFDGVDIADATIRTQTQRWKKFNAR